MLLSSFIYVSLRKVVVIMAMCNGYKVAPVMLVGAQIVGGLVIFDVVVPEPIETTFLRVWLVIIGSCFSIDCWHNAFRLRPLHQFVLLLNMFDDVINVGHHLSPLEMFFYINVYLDDLSFSS